MVKRKPTPLIMFRVRPEIPADASLQRRLKRAATLTGKPMSQLLREATEHKLKELARRYPEIEAA